MNIDNSIQGKSPNSHRDSNLIIFYSLIIIFLITIIVSVVNLIS